MGTFYLGLDLGQAQDYTALAVVCQVGDKTNINRCAYHVTWLERFKLGTPYPDVVDRINTMLEKPPLNQGCYLIVDATGVRRPVMEMMKRKGINPIAVTITAGIEVIRDEFGYYRVPKRDLVGELQVLLQEGRLKIAEALEHSRTLVQELMDFKVKITAAAHDTYGVWREGVHDDLVLAVALACWFGENMVVESVFEVQDPRELGMFEL